MDVVIPVTEEAQNGASNDKNNAKINGTAHTPDEVKMKEVCLYYLTLGF